MDNELLEEIMFVCPRRRVVSCCKKLIKKCSFKSGESMGYLCELSYWLYIYGYKKYIKSLAEPTHNLEFNGNYSVWSPIFSLWGLEIRIMREHEKYDEADMLCELINHYYLIPNKFETTCEDAVRRENKRRSVSLFDYPECTYQNEMSNSDCTKNDIIYWKSVSLMHMIGNGETGLFPKMNEHKDEIENCIQQYISDLSEVK